MRDFKRLAIVVLSLCLAACATPQYIGGEPAASMFERVGRFAVSADIPGEPQQAAQGGFAWQDAGKVLKVDLATPMGATLARVQVQPGHARLTPAEGDEIHAATADALLEQVLGSPVPVAQLRYWLRGQLGPEPAQEVKLDEQKRPESFRQEGWSVVLSRYDTQGPRLLRLSRQEAGRQISVRLVVDASQP
ncbi:outer membrane lipoprotein LolB [Pusillimonas sp. CC-YST705]|uniref:Outer-membrane lipoprotein LolB n=1 Tax=Mesopusillimonas faecipullorum TaxID=2755040 RepID=A0ABS8CBR8_9BURK|nr:lipoprotein insertase outer membrane protein LolB [Mesopusillimonas faecipullorum]MCB5363480.1 outer membrane lipoprotein LolB [Mesopusillimonas faecipullorum]